MKVSIDLRKSDLLLVSLQMLPRQRGNWWLLLAVATAVFLVGLWHGAAQSGWTLLIAAGTGLVSGLGGLLAGFLINVASMLLLAGRRPGVLGRHDYELLDTGIFETTSVNEGLSRWSGISRLLCLRRHIVVIVQDCGAHILPRRAFASDSEYQAFYRQALALRAAAVGQAVDGSDALGCAGAQGVRPKRRWLTHAVWLGICLLLVVGLRLQDVGSSPRYAEAATDGQETDPPSEEELIRGLLIEGYRERVEGNQLLVLGSLLNQGGKAASSIELEVELFDEQGQFVYECSEYLSRKLQPGERENFQIKCGCGKNPLPAHARMTVRVVSASSYF